MRLAIVSTHPIQYYAPWFRQIAQTADIELKVFYLWDFGVTRQLDRGFGVALQWDIDLLAGYEHAFVPNVAVEPGTHHFRGIDNPALAGELAAFRPDAVLLLGYWFKSFMRLLLRPRWPLLLRGDSHDLAPTPGWRGALRRWLQARIFSRFSGALAVGVANRAYLRRRAIPDQHIGFAPHCIDLARFADAEPAARARALLWRRELGITDGATVVLFAGKFETKKQPLQLIVAFQAVAGDSDVLLLAGAGPLQAQVDQAVAADPRLRRLPFQNQSAMPALYALADLFVLPSLGPGETWGLAVNEAMAMGAAVLVSTHVGCQQDLVEDGLTGLVARAGDACGLQQTLARALREPLLRQRLAAAGRARVQDYNYAAATAGLQELLVKIVGPQA